ncbi:MAG: hypothetical protein ACXWXO_08050 [Nocardioides sp.]
MAVIVLAVAPRPVSLASRSLWAASWWVVRRPALLVPAGLALVLVLGTLPALDDGYGLRVLRGAGLLLACAWVSTTDDPSGEVLGGSPYPRAVRTAVRVLTGGAVIAVGWVVAAAVVQWRAPDVPVLGVGLESLALGVLGIALGVTMRSWRDQHQPAHTAVVGLAVLAFASSALPRWYTLLQSQTWGPPWEAAQVRWAAVLLLAVGLVGLALRDPLARR